MAIALLGRPGPRLLMMTGDRDFAEFVKRDEATTGCRQQAASAFSSLNIEKVVATAARYGMETSALMPFCEAYAAPGNVGAAPPCVAARFTPPACWSCQPAGTPNSRLKARLKAASAS